MGSGGALIAFPPPLLFMTVNFLFIVLSLPFLCGEGVSFPLIVVDVEKLPFSLFLRS